MYDLFVTSFCEHALENWEMTILCVKYMQRWFLRNKS